ncbi:hypothetical protein MKFW12EY_19780 [Methylomonas koyamae]|nr:hypothetical protein MKFW12EY_19780 [Methylomonas koyamae]
MLSNNCRDKVSAVALSYSTTARSSANGDKQPANNNGAAMPRAAGKRRKEGR